MKRSIPRGPALWPRRRAVRCALACAAAAVLSAPFAPMPAQAADYPNRPVTVVIPYPAGGANDMLGRLLAQKLSAALGQPFIVDNRPGAGALLGAGIVAHARPDGYTILVGGLATHAASPHLIKADYDPVNGFESIGLIGSAPTIVITSPDSPYRTLGDVVAAAKKERGSIMYGSSGNGSPLHLAGAQFAVDEGLELTHVPYKGGTAHILDLIGGRIPVVFDTATNSMPLIRSGKVRPLAIGQPQRSPDLPDVPTFAEAGFPKFRFSSWYGLFAPAGTPADVVARLSTTLQQVLKDPDVIERLKGVGVTPASGGQDELARLVPVEYERIGRLIGATGIKAD